MTAHKLLSLAQLLDLLPQWRAARQCIVFTNGCFDLMHPGHVEYLEAARAQGDRLVIGLNSDRSVRALKGDTRPILPEAARARLLTALAAVDAVVIFDEDTPATLIGQVRPDVLAKGADYQLHEVVGADLVQSYGGRVALIEFVEGYSTSDLVQRIRGEG
jgi:D-beta-D-heptose 7-phosphate kinase / D-beta-D-heptose 1-phosphate adenosyltransferase